MLNKVLDQLVHSVADKPASTEAHFTVTVLKEICLTCSEDVRMLICSKLWKSIDSLREKEKETTLKLLLEQFAVIFLFLGTSNNMPKSSSHFDHQTQTSVFDFLLSYTLNNSSFDLRVLGLMCFKLSSPFIQTHPSSPELAILKDKLIEGTQTRDATEVKCLVDFYFDLVAKLKELDEETMRKDFPVLQRIEKAVVDHKENEILKDENYEAIVYIFLAYVNFLHSIGNCPSWIPHALSSLLTCTLKWTDGSVASELSKATYLVRLFRKYDLQNFGILSSNIWKPIVSLSHKTGLTEDEETAVLGLESKLADLVTSSLKKEETADLINQKLLGLKSERIEDSSLNLSLLRFVLQKQHIQIEEPIFNWLLGNSLNSQDKIPQEFVETYLYTCPKLSSHSVSLEFFLNEISNGRLKPIDPENSYVARILKCLLSRMHNPAFTTVQKVFNLILSMEEVTPGVVKLFEILFSSHKEGSNEENWKAQNPLHLQRLFKTWSNDSSKVDQTKLLKLDLLLANKLPASCTKDRLESYLKQVSKVVLGYPRSYDKQMLVSFQLQGLCHACTFKRYSRTVWPIRYPKPQGYLDDHELYRA